MNNKIEINNLKEEIEDILESCNNCGLCKSNCPIFKILRNEHNSPRGKVLKLKQKFIDTTVLKCGMCKSCEINCPKEIKICSAIRKAREILLLKKN